jgi:beta-lactam-binding protein with PASTA domain
MRNETLDQMASAGEIIEQDPSAGTEVEAGSSVNVTTSVRPSTKVPKIVGLRLPQARGELAAAGLKLGDENETPSETAPEGEIVGQYPMANTEARRDSFIRVSVSSGPNRVLGWRASGKIRALVDVSEHANSSDVSEEAKNAVAWDTEAENQDDRGGYKVFSAANLIVVVTWMIGVVVVLVILALIAR